MRLVISLITLLIFNSCRFAVTSSPLENEATKTSSLSLSMTNSGYTNYCYLISVSRSQSLEEELIQLSSSSPGSFSLSTDPCGASVSSLTIPEGASEATIFFSPSTDDNYVISLESAKSDSVNLPLTVSTPGTSGTIDTVFGTAGFTRVSGISSRSIAKQTDDKIISAHSQGGDIRILRLTKDGHLDNTFGTSGFVTVDAGGSDTFGEVTTGADDSIYVVGYDGNGASGSHFVIKLTKEGALDTSFSSNGIYNATNPWYSRVRRIAIQADNKVIFGGDEHSAIATNRHLVIRRLNSNGSLDTSYGTSGVFESTWDSGNADSYDIQVLASGDTIAIGYTANPSFQGLLTKVKENGIADTSFGTGGYAPLGSSLQLPYTVSEFGGRLFAAGESGNNQVIAAYDSSGNLDTSFGTAGYYSQFIGGGGWGDGHVHSSDGTIYLNGRSSNSNTADVNITKLDLNGNKILSWGTAGVLTLDMDAARDVPSKRPIIQEDGKLVYSVESRENDLVTNQQVFFRIWP